MVSESGGQWTKQVERKLRTRKKDVGDVEEMSFSRWQKRNVCPSYCSMDDGKAVRRRSCSLARDDYTARG